MRIIRFYILALGALVLGVLPALTCADEHPDEYNIKAAILYKLIKYVEWPNAPHQITICVVGNDPFGTRLNVIEKQSSADLTLRVRRGVTVATIDQCQVAFISTSEQEKTLDILAKSHKLPVLTVSDITQFSNAGGIVEFVLTEDDKIKFIINLKAATTAQLKMNPQLLEIAKDVIR